METPPLVCCCLWLGDSIFTLSLEYQQTLVSAFALLSFSKVIALYKTGQAKLTVL